jgi:hypothetical protein
VPKPWKPPADDVRASEAFKREVKLQQVRAVVAGAMSSDRCQVSELLPVIEQAFGLKRSAARALLKDAIPEGEGETAEVAPHTYLLKIDKVEPSPPGPVFVVRQHLFEQKAEAA